MGGGHAPGAAVVGATIGMTLLSGMATLMRIYTRLCIVAKPGPDDIFIVAAMIFTIAMTITMNQQVKYGMGRHYDTLTDDDKTNVNIWFWASVWIYYLALGCAKTSILLQYLRIFPHCFFRKACYAMIGIVAAYTAWTFFSAVFACTPIAYFWDTSLNGTCLNRLAVWFVNAALNIVTDIATAVLPLPVLSTLTLPRKQKIILMLVFCLGGLTCIISILRLQSLYAVSIATDITWENPLAATWSNCEVNIAILCSCLPTLKGCVTRFFPKFFTSVHQSRDPASNLGMEGTGLNKNVELSSRAERAQPSQHDTVMEPEDQKIHVVTVVRQDYHDLPRQGDAESTRSLV